MRVGLRILLGRWTLIWYSWCARIPWWGWRRDWMSTGEFRAWAGRAEVRRR